WSSDVCSSDLSGLQRRDQAFEVDVDPLDLAVHGLAQRLDQFDVEAGALPVLDELHGREGGVGDHAQRVLGVGGGAAPGQSQHQGGGQQLAASFHVVSSWIVRM